MIASTLAFMVWALAVPSSPYLTGESGKVIAAFGAILISTFLTLLEPVFEPWPVRARGKRPMDGSEASAGGDFETVQEAVPDK
jgi:hypothetical protein